MFPNLVVVPVGSGGKVNFYNYLGSVDLVADVSGYFTAPWGTAIEVPGTAALNASGDAAVASVSCASAGNCAAGGWYADSSGNSQAFVADEVNGVWGEAVEVPGTVGTAALNAGGDAWVDSVSCASAGNCAAGGSDSGSGGGSQAFVADEVNGAWGDAVEVPGTAALNTGGDAGVGSVSCPSVGNCAAGGSYKSDITQPFVAEEVNGVWGNAIVVPGAAALNTGFGGPVGSVSCPSAGNCVAGGYLDTSTDPGIKNYKAFVADEVNGTWGNAIQMPGTPIGGGGETVLNSLSCSSAGNCAAGGWYTDSTGHSQAFVADEVNGVWGNAIEVPGTAALNTGQAFGVGVWSVSCAPAGTCAAGGSYTDGFSSFQAFVVSQTGA